MAECPKRKLLDLYLSGGVDPALEEIAQGWLAENIDDPDVDAALNELFSEAVKYEAPKVQTYRNLRALQSQLGMNKKEVIHIPIGKRPAFRVAAVLIPVLLIAGVAINISKTRFEPIQDSNIAEATTDTIPQTTLPQTVIPVEIAEVPQTVTVVEKKSKPVHVETPKPTPTVYDFETTTTDRMHKYVILADNSTVILNGGGTIRFCSEKREAFLLGEAYFEVAEGQPLPFKVVTEHLTVNVTGTKFNITALPGNAETFVDLVHGSVNINSKAGNIELKPQEQFTLHNNSGVIKIGKAKSGSWWDEPLVFDGLPLYEILCSLEKCYGIQINGKEKIDNPIPYTIKFSKMSPLKHVLGVIHEIYPKAEYETNGELVTVNMTDADNK